MTKKELSKKLNELEELYRLHDFINDDYNNIKIKVKKYITCMDGIIAIRRKSKVFKKDVILLLLQDIINDYENEIDDIIGWGKERK